MLNPVEKMLFRNRRKQTNEPDDGYPAREVSQWSLQKHRLFTDYLDFFFHDKKLMKYREISLVVLNAGSGFCRSGEHIYRDLPLIALDKRYPFTKYVFSEKSGTQAATLKIRINKLFRSRNTVILPGSEIMEDLEKIKLYLADPASGHKTKSLCLLDITTLEPGFDFIRTLSRLKVEILLFFSLDLNNRKAYQIILDEQSEDLECFMGKPVGDNFKKVHNNESFFRALVSQYVSLLPDLGYNVQGGFYPADVSDSGVSFFYGGYFSMDHSAGSIARSLKNKQRRQYNLFH